MFPSHDPVLTCPVGGKPHTPAKYPGWFSAHCCVFALFAARGCPAPVLSAMVAEPSCREQRESRCLLKPRSPWKWGCPHFALLSAIPLPICPVPGGGCTCRGSGGVYLDPSVHLTAFFSTFFRVLHRQCVFNVGLDLFVTHREIFFLARGIVLEIHPS